MMTRSYHLAFDIGATSGRAMLGSWDGERLEMQEVHRFANTPVRYAGELHWQITALWQEILKGLEKASALAPAIASVAVDTWGVDYALLTRAGSLVELPWHYRDHRTEGVLPEMFSVVSQDEIYATTGIQFMDLNTVCQLFAATRKNPELLAAATHLVTVPDLLNYWLSGVIRAERTNASTTQMVELATGDWAREMLTRLGIPTHFLGEMVEPGTVLGPLRDELRTQAALSGTQVIAPACHDTGSAVAAIDTSAGDAFLSSGTWSLLGAEVPQPYAGPRSLELNFTNEAGVEGTTRLLKNITGMWLVESCRASWGDVDIAALLEEAEAAGPGDWVFDANSPRLVRPENMVSAIEDEFREAGQAPPATRGAMVRAILEALAARYAQTLAELESITQVRYRALRVIGGGSRNALLNRLTAEAIGRPVLAGPVEATALGNLLVQLVAMGHFPNVKTARQALERTETPIEYRA